MTRRPIPILLYHGVDRDPPPDLAPWVMDPDRFADHLGLLAARGTTTVTVSELCRRLDAGEDLPDDLALVTFDDGLADFDEHAWPVLRDLGIAATLYVVAGAVGGNADWLAPFGPPPPMLTWDQVRRLDAEGCEIGAHSRTHPELDTLRSADLVDEVRGSRTDLALQLGHPVASFAYPHGYHHRAAVEAVRRAGFASACAVRNLYSSPADDRFALARITVTADWTTDQLAAVLDGRGPRVAPRRPQARTVAWRTYRRARSRRARPTAGVAS